ncbi:hypothetical protein LV28_24735 [Pandoraea pnomenusa]|uniref:Uncharacterized protein n=1 Tax=Pandoraea pnomenusa TaxID=93220 RepID=A0A378YZZ3_9BURK|nr:hypothetical protein [Pandoraea pnomenusa]AIU29350.1 hypothetical protein LV28_24735 [Pandoraea pnomenusa]SUA81999.1 Uncharacterised protein [Pandoraea pnomenusa]
MAGLTKAQKAEKAAAEARAKALAVAGVTEEQFAALSGDEQAKILATAETALVPPKGGANGDDDGPELVTMIRDADLYDGPHEAQVHPDEVDNYRVGGWEEA